MMKIGISYSPELIEELQSEHHILRESLELIKTSLAQKKYKDTAQLIDEYATLALSHLTKENLKIYAYLHDYFKDDSDTKRTLRKLRKEMILVQIAVVNFFQNYQNFYEDTQKHSLIHAAFGQVYALAMKRMHTEETYVYPLYGTLAKENFATG